MTKTLNAGHALLAKKDPKKDTIEFTEKVLHGRLAFHKGEVVKFEDPAAATYFDLAFNGTEYSDKEPTRELTNAEINFDPEDPSGNETIDPDTIIGVGREGVAPGTSVAQVADGNPMASHGDAPPKLAVRDVEGKSGT